MRGFSLDLYVVKFTTADDRGIMSATHRTGLSMTEMAAVEV